MAELCRRGCFYVLARPTQRHFYEGKGEDASAEKDANAKDTTSHRWKFRIILSVNPWHKIKKITPLPSPPSTTSLTQFPPTHTHINHMLNHQLDARVAGRGLKGEEVGQPPSSQTEAIVKVCGVVHFPSPHTHTLTASQRAGQRLNGRRDEVAHFLPLH